MSNLTISIDDHLIKQARVRAIQQGTSLSAKIREYIAAYASGTADRLSGDATTDLLRMIDDVRTEVRQNAAAEASGSGAGSGPSTPASRSLREELHEGDFRARDRLRGALADRA
jgi:plasmid stability protein